MQVLHVQCDSALERRTLCYAIVIQDSCSTSAADINMLKTIIYAFLVSTSCTLGKLPQLGLDVSGLACDI